MPDKDSRKYRELKQQFIDAENHLLYLDRGKEKEIIASYAAAREEYLVAKQALNRFLDSLRKKGKGICPNYDRVVKVIEDTQSRECDVHPDERCGGLTRSRGSCRGQFNIIQRARKGPSYAPGRD